MSDNRPTRTEREQELHELNRTAGGRQQVVELFYTIFPDGVPLPKDVSMIDIILTHEYGTNSSGNDHDRHKAFLKDILDR